MNVKSLENSFYKIASKNFSNYYQINMQPFFFIINFRIQHKYTPLDFKKITHNDPKGSPISHDVHPVFPEGKLDLSI